MTTTYPGAIDSYTVKVDNVTDVLASHVNNLQDAVVAVETAVGTEGNQGLMEFRLTLASGSPFGTGSAATTVYLTPYKGNRISLYNGSDGWVTHNSAEVSVAVPSTTVTPFDIFAYSNSGTVTLETVNWTNDTTRATGLVLQDGVYVKSGATTRRYLGTGRTTGVSGQCEVSATKMFLWNYYNRENRLLSITNTSSHNYDSTWRAWNNDAANSQVEFIVGVAETVYNFILNGSMTYVAGGSIARLGLAVNNTTSPGASAFLLIGGTMKIDWCELFFTTAARYNYVVGVEQGDNTGADPGFASLIITGTVPA